MASVVPAHSFVEGTRYVRLRRGAGLMATTALALFWTATTVEAQTASSGSAIPSESRTNETVHDFNIPAQPLSSALSVFSRQTGLQISQPASLGRDVTSTTVNGRYTAQQGLQRLLQGSGIRFHVNGDNAAVLGQSAEPVDTSLATGSTELEAITVRGGRVRSPKDEVFTAPKSTVYISSETIDRFGHRTAGDMLKGQPGVQVGDSRNGGGLDVNIRGVQGQNRIAVTVDGGQQALDTYRGYAGTQQRSYIDPDLIGGVLINKGPSLAAGASGAIGGTVAMQTIGVTDILKDGATFGVKLKGDLSNNGISPQEPRTGVPRWERHEADARTERGNIFNSDAKSGSAAVAYTNEYFDLVGAFAKRNEGNYFAGSHGRDRYRIFTPVKRWDGSTYLREENSVAKVYKEGEEVMNTSSNTQSVLLKATIRPTDEQTLDVGFRHFDGRFGEIMPSVIYRGSDDTLGQWPLGSMKIDALNARYAYDPADSDLINFRANAWMTDADSELLNGGPMVPRSQRSDFDNDYGWARQQNRRWGIDASNKAEFDTGLGQATLDFGASFMNETIRPADGVVITLDDRNNNRILRDGDRQEGNLSGQFTLQPTEAFSVRLGGRYVRFNSKDNNRHSQAIYEKRSYRNILLKDGTNWVANAFWFADKDGNFTDATNPLLNDGNATTYTDNSEVRIGNLKYNSTTVYAPQVAEFVKEYKYGNQLERNDGGFAPAFGISHNITEDSLVYVNYTEGLRMPGLFESSQGTLQVVQSATLKHERSRAWEIGASTMTSDLLSPGDTAGLKLAYFNTKIDDYITRFYNPTGNGMMLLSNAESFKVSGLELQANYDEGRFFADLSTTYYFNAETCDPVVAAQLRAAASIYTRTENTPDCTPGGFSGSYANTQNPPKYAVNVTAGARFLDETLTIGGRMTYTSGPVEKLDQPWQKNVTAAQVFYHPVAVFDAFMAYELREDAVLNLSVENLTDRYYLDPLAQSLMPAPGRTFRAGLTMKF
ncbi:putative TonB-dependent receptor [Ensifer sp. M14]|nr:putative TonB-dependent receptor [Ensifer sp. M14]